MLDKNPIHKWRPFFMMIGLAGSLSITLMAFEWKSYDDKIIPTLGELQLGDEDEEQTKIYTVEKPKPKPIPKMPKPVVVEEEDDIPDMDFDFVEDFNEDDEIVVDDYVSEDDEEVVEDIFEIVEESAEPNGGISKFYRWVGKNIKYPSQAKRMGVEGKVYVQFVIDKDGSITDLKVVRGIGAGCDEEAIRVLQKANKWKPGKQRGRAVKQRMVLPISFKLG